MDLRVSANSVTAWKNVYEALWEEYPLHSNSTLKMIFICRLRKSSVYIQMLLGSSMKVLMPFSAKLLFRVCRLSRRVWCFLEEIPFRRCKFSPNPHNSTEWLEKKVRSSHDKNRLPLGDLKGVLFVGKHGGFRPLLGENCVKVEVQPCLFSIISNIVPLVSCKNLSFCSFFVSSSTFATKTHVHFARHMSLFRTMIWMLCQYQLLGSERKWVLVDCNPTHLSLESGGCLVGSEGTMTSFVLSRLANGSRVWHYIRHDVGQAAVGMLSGDVLFAVGWGCACTGADEGFKEAIAC